MTRATLLLSLAMMAAVPALAAPPIYRCGTDGRTYSQVPCPEGSLIEASDPRTAAQRAEAKRLAEAERKRAADAERERKLAEKAVTPESGTTAAPPTAATAAPAAPKLSTTASR